jgi:trigger factor
MKVTLEKLPKSQVCFDIEVEGEKSQAIYDRTVQKLTRSIQVPGFRKGKAPKQLVMRQVGTEQIKAGVLEELLEETLTQALKEQEDLNAIGSFELVTPIEEILANFTLGQTLNFRAAIDVQPEVTLKNYKGLSVKAEKIEPDLEQADKTLREFQIKHSTLVPIEDRGAQIGDVVTVDLSASDPETGEEMTDAGAEDLQLDMDVDEFVPAIIEGIVGMTVDETKEIDVDFPEDFVSRDMAGKSVKFAITLKDLKTRELPALDDDFAKTISEKETMAELREYLDNRAVEEAEDKTKENTEKAILEALVQQIEVDLPASLINKEAAIIIQQQAMYLQRSAEGAKLAKQLFTREFIGEMRRINEPEAIARLKRTLALAEVAKQEKLENTKEEEDKRAAEVLQSLQGESVDPQRLAEVVADELLTEKAMEFLQQNAQIEYVAEGELTPELEAIAETANAPETVAAPEAIAEAAATSEVVVEVVTEASPEIAEAIAVEAEVVEVVDQPPPTKTTKRTKKVKA